jgi:hypothetical protein
MYREDERRVDDYRVTHPERRTATHVLALAASGQGEARYRDERSTLHRYVYGASARECHV